MLNATIINRRRFLAGMGAGLSMAAASSLLPMNAMAASSSRPQRFVVYWVPHGWPIEQVNIFGQGSSWLNDNKILGGFSPWQDKVTVVRGISQTSGGSHGGVHKILTGDGSGDSIDTIIAKKLNTRPWVQGVISSDYFSLLNKENGSFTQQIGLPLDFVDQAFGQDNGSTAEASKETQLRIELLNMSERQLDALANKVSGLSHEESRLASHIASVREVKARAGREIPGGLLGTGVGELRARLENTANLAANDLNNTTPILDGHIDALATAMISGVAKVGTIRSHGSGGKYTANFPGGPGIEGNPHMNSHSGDLNRRINEYGKNLRWYLDRLATFMNRLDVVDPLDPSHTVMENTTILYTSEMADGAHIDGVQDHVIGGQTHQTYFPMVLLGGCAGKIRTGGVIDAYTSHLDLLQTLAHIHDTSRGSGNVINSLIV